MARTSQSPVDLDYARAGTASAPHSDSRWKIRLIRFSIVLGALFLWFLTQYLIGRRAFPDGRIGDGIFELTAPIHRYLTEHPKVADGLLISSSLLIDFLGIYIIAVSIFGRSVRPFVGLMILFALRQMCQALCALPAPDGMIWRDPGFPSLLVTYGTSNDLFFSGHTALAVYGAIVLARSGGPLFLLLGGIIALYQIVVVLLLRAHYTMDVFAGAVTAVLIAYVILPKRESARSRGVSPVSS